MPKGSKQDREIQHIIDSEKKSGKTQKEASSIAYGHMKNQQKNRLGPKTPLLPRSKKNG